MLNKIKNRKEGFTIIEVLIVLAIAGLILLVVFLAVPALQRNSRNTQRKNEVASVLGAVNEWMNNNGGTPPPDQQTQAAALQNAKLSFYANNVTWGAVGANTSNANTAVVVAGARCNTDGSTTAGSTRQMAVMYTVETGGGTQAVCQES